VIPSLKAGNRKTDTSGVIKTAQGFVIVRLKDRITWEEVKRDATDDYAQEEKSKRFDEWLKRAKAEAKLEIKDELLKAFELEKADKTDEALVLYEKLVKSATDPFVPYYVAKIYQSKLSQARQKKATLSNEQISWTQLAELFDLPVLLQRIETVAGQSAKIPATLASSLQELAAQFQSRLTGANTSKPEELKSEFVTKLEELLKDHVDEQKQLIAAFKAEEIPALEQEIELYTQKSLEYLTKTAEGAAGDEGLYQTILDMDDENPIVHFRYGYWLYGEGKIPEAMAQVKRAIDLKPDYVEALILYGDLNAGNRGYGTAAEYYERALPLLEEKEAKRRAELQEKLAETYFGLGQWDEAKALYQALYEATSEKDSKKYKFGVALGDVAYEQKEYATAEKFYQTAYQREPSRYEYRTKLAKAYAGLNKLNEAITLFQRVTKDSPYIAEAWLGLGDAYQAKNDKESALKAYEGGFKKTADPQMQAKLGEKILELNPQDTATRLELAEKYKEQHIFEFSIKHYEEILKQDPSANDRLTALLGIGDSYVGRAEYEQGHEYYESALEAAPDEAAQAKVYEKIIENEPKIEGVGKPFSALGKEALLRLGEYYQKITRTEQAKELLQKLQNMDPQYEPATVERLLGEIEGKKREPTAALGPDGKPGQPVEEQGATHIRQEERHTGYNTIPPTSGPHYGTDARWGLHQEPVANELQVHNLEHGGVLVQYKPDLSREVIQQIEALVTDLRRDAKYCKMIVAPYPGLDTEIALTAWTRIDKFNGFDADRIKAFADAWLEQGPEKGIPCR
jgi:tetratricopeptide (TPR) repeat protein